MKKNLKNSKTTLKIHYTFTYCLKMKNFITVPCLPVNFVGLRLGFDVPEQIAPLRRCMAPGFIQNLEIECIIE